MPDHNSLFNPTFKPGDRVVPTRSFEDDETLSSTIGYIQSMDDTIGMVGTVLWTQEDVLGFYGVTVYAINFGVVRWYWPESHLEWGDLALTRPLAGYIPEDLAKQMAIALRR